MKIIIAEIFLFSLFIVALTNLTISNRASNLAQGKQELTQSDNFANALYQANEQTTIEKRKLTAKELSDINTYQSLNDIALWTFISSLTIFILMTIFLIVKSSKLRFNTSNLSIFILIVSWLMIVASYYLFNFWGHQQTNSYYNAGAGFWENDRSYYLFSGAGFSPTIYFSIIWISKNFLTFLCFFLNRQNKSSKGYVLIKALCWADLILGNLVILFVHDSFAGVHTIIDLRMNRLE